MNQPGAMTRFYRRMGAFYEEFERLKAGQSVPVGPLLASPSTEIVSLPVMRRHGRVMGPPPTITWGGPRLTTKALADLLGAGR